MPASAPTVETESVADLLLPDLLVDGAEPEQRVLYSDISWDRYLALDKRLGDDRPGPRLYYLDGELEIMSTSTRHEIIKKWIGDLVAVYFEIAGTEIVPHGQATMRERLKSAGLEPDESWCIGEEKHYADLVLEIALSSGGIPKLQIYKRFAIPEVWFWRRNRIEIFALNSSGEYESVPRSKLLADLDIGLLERCINIENWQEARRTFRAALSK
jgi:Uma2 family endonuclease